MVVSCTVLQIKRDIGRKTPICLLPFVFNLHGPLKLYNNKIIIIKTFITRKVAEAANARSVDSTEEKRLQSLFEDVQQDVR